MATDLPITPVPKKSFRVAAFAILVGLTLITLAGAGMYALGMRRQPVESSVVGAPPSPSPATPPPERQIEPEGTAPVAAPAAPKLVVRANHAIKSLSVDGKPVDVDSAADEIPITLTPEQAGKKLKLEAVSADGRKASLEVDAGTERVSLNFPGSASGAMAGTSRPARPATKGGSGSREPSGKVGRDSPKAPELPGLAPTPYDNK